MRSFVPLSFVLAIVTLVRANPLVKRAATVYMGCSVSNNVALTFDDGPYIYEQSIVDTLNNANAKGTFFVNGNNYACIFDQDRVANLKYALSNGHEIGSHTWSHPDLTTLNSDQINTELTRLDDALRKILGVSPALMRPPYGNYNDLVLTVAENLGLSLVMWDFDSGDSTGSTPAQSEQSYTDVANKHPSNLLALNHETVQTTAEEVLPYALQKLGAQGYKFVTVAECLGVSPYKSTTAPGTRDSTWTCS